MQTQAQIYRSIRHQQPILPALAAWHHAGHKLEVDRWTADTGFRWNLAGCLAGWYQSDYHVTAELTLDEHGWDMDGVDTIGTFQNSWIPGAIEHERFNRRVLDWFVPANPSYAVAHPEYGHAMYRRACAYGHDWEYQVLMVKARRAGVELGVAVLGGIESDSGEDFITATVCDLAAEAVAEADANLRKLCDRS